MLSSFSKKRRSNNSTEVQKEKMEENLPDFDIFEFMMDIYMGICLHSDNTNYKKDTKIILKKELMGSSTLVL